MADRCSKWEGLMTSGKCLTAASLELYKYKSICFYDINSKFKGYKHTNSLKGKFRISGRKK